MTHCFTFSHRYNFYTAHFSKTTHFCSTSGPNCFNFQSYPIHCRYLYLLTFISIKENVFVLVMTNIYWLNIILQKLIMYSNSVQIHLNKLDCCKYHWFIPLCRGSDQTFSPPLGCLQYSKAWCCIWSTPDSLTRLSFWLILMLTR